MKKFYLTTAIPYVNGLPHVGHSLEYFQADTVRRYYQLKSYDTLLLSGADENALKNVQASEKEGLPIQQFLDINSKIWAETYEFLGVHLDIFQRGSDQKKHWPGVQKFWKLCQENGDIYKKEYAGLYCIGCESFKTNEELINGLCPTHQTKPELIKEENYFFKLSKYQDKLVQLIENNELKITPDNKRQEALSFIKSGLEDFSISRSNERAKGIGVPVPGDPDQKIYVWFDALNIYMTGIGFGWDDIKYQKWWPADLHIIGKDINRFHTVYWPAMLLSAGLPLPKQILIHGFVNLKGEKISKSVGNVISPQDVVKEFGLEPLRYFMLSQNPIDSDGDFTFERFKEVYNGDLANGLGNLVARVAKLAENSGFEVTKTTEIFDPLVEEKLKEFKFNEALDAVWQDIAALDKKINQVEPWKLEANKLEEFLSESSVKIRSIALTLSPFLPETSQKILKQFSGKIQSAPPLFPRI
ncbi:TPA: methionine--tRNA ligase [Candidatus Daviesbacteria bacterium]|uniref:Methionine--tRNA ligase n=1 Tax=Candidatus Daviesbacteria bacterium GW2011_GWF2_38_6 TaxID=1618432 RepID=A0A0G0MYC8_9BACT|nr:MAG: Methionine-tRNA ligase [Candidatus Daviesbacteria bacterium GW2011_GWF2_38_6]HCB23006.1 methionine--tRNA ligase [Candidatus Daviesbacteria bacterium]